MTEADPRREAAPEATAKGSRGPAASMRALGGRVGPVASRFVERAGGTGTVVLALGAIAALLLIVAEFSTLVSVEVITATCEDLAQPEQRDLCTTTGGEQHSYALLVLGVAVALMAFGAGMGASRPAAGALVAIGLLVLGIALIGDLPETNETGAIGSAFAEAEASAGVALWLEILGGLVAIGAGVLRLRAPD